MRNDREIPEKTLQTTPLEDSQSAGRVAGWVISFFLSLSTSFVSLAVTSPCFHFLQPGEEAAATSLTPKRCCIVVKRKKCMMELKQDVIVCSKMASYVPEPWAAH